MKRRIEKKGKNKWADHYTLKAQKEQYPARSVYKLQEIQKKTLILNKGQRILDLGCAPGSWLLYAAEVTGGKGEVVGVDLNPVTITLPVHVKTCVADMLIADDEFRAFVGDGYDVVISDMAPSTTGIKVVDVSRSSVLCEAALNLAEEVLVPGGNFVCKIFQGPDFEIFLNRIKTGFSKHKIFKPQSCRKASREIYIIGMGKK
jgi:23S rRNA (uridine2552-2'-O)-methyltransferase